MKCVTPMFRIYEKMDYNNGHVISREEANMELQYDNNYYRAIKIFNKKNPYKNMEMIACQHCWACLMNKAAEKATEIMAEAQMAENPCWFITLTYDDLHIPIAEKLQYKKKIKIPGAEPYYEIQEYENDGTWIKGTLNPKDLKRFVKRMREDLAKKGIYNTKFYACGEYGSQTERPHYHIVLINVPLDITQFYAPHIDENFKKHWKSKQIERWWGEPRKKKNRQKLGIVDVTELEWSSAAYTARYTAKKIFNTKSKESYYENGRLPEFTRSSKNIGKEYYDIHKHEIYKNDEMIGRTIRNRIGRYKPPKKYDNWFKEEFPEEWESIKLSRAKAAERAEELEKELSDYTDLELQNIATRKVLEKCSMLPRVGEWEEE